MYGRYRDRRGDSPRRHFPPFDLEAYDHDYPRRRQARRPGPRPYSGRAYDGPPYGSRAYDGPPPYRRGYDGPPPHGRRGYDGPPPERRRRRRAEEWRRGWERLRERGEERWGGRARELLRRYREPIIGLTIAGAAAPMVKPARAEAEAPPERHMREARAAATRPSDVEEAVSREWARSEAEQIREDTIEGARIRYGISRDLAEEIYDAAIRNDIDPDVAFGLVNTESTFDERAVSHVGARGLTQVMPRTARWLRPGTTAEDLFDRRLNLDLGFRYLRRLIDKYDGNIRLALLAYNRGPGTVDRILARGGDPDNGYADRVLSG